MQCTLNALSYKLICNIPPKVAQNQTYGVNTPEYQLSIKRQFLSHIKTQVPGLPRWPILL